MKSCSFLDVRLQCGQCCAKITSLHDIHCWQQVSHPTKTRLIQIRCGKSSKIQNCVLLLRLKEERRSLYCVGCRRGGDLWFSFKYKFFLRQRSCHTPLRCQLCPSKVILLRPLRNFETMAHIENHWSRAVLANLRHECQKFHVERFIFHAAFTAVPVCVYIVKSMCI